LYQCYSYFAIHIYFVFLLQLGRARDIGATGGAGKPGDGGPVGWTDQSGLPGRDGVGGFDGFDCKNTDTGRQGKTALYLN